MGLVLLAPTEPMLAPAGTETPASPAQTAAATGGLFASLLASLGGALEGGNPAPAPASASETTAIPLPAIAPEAKDGTEDGNTAALALAALALAAPMMLPATQQAQSAESTAAGQPAMVTQQVTGLPAMGDPADLDKAVAEAPSGPSAAPSSELPPAEASNQPAADASITPVAAVETAVPAAKPPARDANPHGDAPPTEAQAAEAVAIESVVRPVGNAETSTAEDGGNADARTRHHDAAPLSRVAASAPASTAPAAVQPAPAAPVDATAAPAEATASAPAQAVETPPQVEHVARAVIERVEHGGGEARIHLDPAGLGEVTIRVHTQGERVHVDIQAQRHEAAQLLRDHTQDLSSLLGDRGLNLADVNVGLGRGQAGEQWAEQQSQRNRPAAGEFASIFGADQPSSSHTHNRLRAAYNPDGAVVYRV
ncbi:MAG: flagellar hook-length control protein FliK [Dehalococcoidia bacterium]|nr:flagellar hook-length control protein FliK [Dehalococcoidia bacterium]